MNVLIIYAHPSAESYNAALKNAAITALLEKGANVKESDLYAMGFNPVAHLNDVIAPHNIEEVAEDVRLEREKVDWANYLIFQFPMWWTSAPAIVKGWFDRVFAANFAYGPGVYNHGNLKGKKAMLSITTGGRNFNSYGKDRIKGEITERLFNIQHEILYFCGLEVIEPFIVPAGVSEEERRGYLDELALRMFNLESLPTIAFKPLEAYGAREVKA